MANMVTWTAVVIGVVALSVVAVRHAGIRQSQPGTATRHRGSGPPAVGPGEITSLSEVARAAAREGRHRRAGRPADRGE